MLDFVYIKNFIHNNGKWLLVTMVLSAHILMISNEQSNLIKLPQPKPMIINHQTILALHNDTLLFKFSPKRSIKDKFIAIIVDSAKQKLQSSTGYLQLLLLLFFFFAK